MKYVISAGGTGGHIYPAISLANSLVEDGHEVLFIASKNGIDQQIFEQAEKINFTVCYKDLRGFNRQLDIQTIFKNVLNLFKLIFLLLGTTSLYLRKRPDCVIGFGGYISYPYVFMASVFKIKTAIHEQNSYPGLVNRKLAKRVDHVFYTFKSSVKYFSAAKDLVYTSNPRVDEVHEYVSTHPHHSIYSTKSILFLGGSLGADKINELALDYAKHHPEITVVLVCGDRNYDEYTQLEHPSNFKLLAYLTEPIKYFLGVDTVVTRAGATTLLELVAARADIIAIPSPNVVADHQTKNASELADLQLLEYIAEPDANVETLAGKINALEHHYALRQERLDEFNKIEVLRKMKRVING